MSVCVSKFGEFGTHTINANLQCIRCGEMDTAAVATELGALRAVVDALRVTLATADYLRSTQLGRGVIPIGPGAVVIDYRALLIRYIDHVSLEEGTVFLSPSKRPPGRFTDEEWMELTHLASTELPSDPPRPLMST